MDGNYEEWILVPDLWTDIMKDGSLYLISEQIL